MGEFMPEEQRRAQQIEAIARWIINWKHIVVFTGAGISTDSGIPDFRGPNGVWTRRDAGVPAPRWRVPPGQVEPNLSHLSLVELQRLGRLQFLITQNTDNLHRRSGIRPELLAELHGNGQLMRCLGCKRTYTRQEVGWDRDRWGPGYRTQKPITGQPVCADCGGRLVSSVVNFGDSLPHKELALAEHHARHCDLMVVLGSSLMVEPAASLVGLALKSGTQVILVNQGKTPYDSAVTLRSWAGIGEVIPQAVERVRRALEEQPNWF
ncbi:MAG: NAD-dependent protein deacetylase of SIR2 family [uncultured Rubrobacteraceae bacterium]|uniref:protein acetyllysine N-acetyltransferase n=1 Tax=uncultured Rubrobacteraceae bacterium TaxID=349277 RepID=A0A6J4QZ52_9ACTN|nr:MAG: NAD-dependent protein deacetylase of SIR2 family [uncultured Rubrobacteraceae bacterium]